MTQKLYEAILDAVRAQKPSVSPELRAKQRRLLEKIKELSSAERQKGSDDATLSADQSKAKRSAELADLSRLPEDRANLS